MPRQLSCFAFILIGVCSSLFLSAPLAAQESLLSDEVVVTPDVASTPSRAANSSGYSAIFTVENPNSSSDTYDLFCSESGPVTCGTIQVNGVNVEMVSVGAHQSKQVTVFYSVGSTGVGTLTLTASGSTSDDGAWTVPVAGAPTVTIQVPGSGATATVHNRQPIIRAFLTPTNDVIDTTKTRLVWRGDTVTAIARHNRRLIEWEVDSTRWLRTGLSGFSGPDTARLVIIACGQVGGCDTSATRNVILPNDSLPILGFTGMPLGTLNGGFSAGFGPGLTVVGAEIETGFSTPAFFSMGVARSTGLVYSTRQSYARALVNVDLDLPFPATSAASVKLVLIDGSTRLDSLVLSSPNTACLTGSVRRCRATLQGKFTSGGSSVTITRKWLKVEATTVVSGVSRMTTDSVEAVIVDRRGSSYGSGWWPSAMAKVVAAGSDRILVGPTGSAVVYRGSGDSVYLPPPGNFTELRKVGGVWELRARGSQAVTTFDSHGRLVRVADPSGNRDSLLYSGTTDRITSIRDPLNKTLTFAYNGSSKLTTITDPGSRVTTVTIDAGTNQLRKRQLPADAARPDTVGYAYQTYAGTNTAVLLRRHGVLGDTTLVVYDVTLERPASVRLPKVAIAADPDTIPIVEYFAYERQGHGALRSLDSVYVEMKDPRGNWTRSLLNRWAQARRSWDAIGLLGRSQYDADGFLQWSEGKNGDSSRVYSAYDAARRLVRTYINRGSMTGSHVLRMDSLVYDASHRVTSRIDARGQAAQYTYDAQGRVTKVRTPNGASWDSVRTWYASNGLVDSTKHSGYLGKATRYTYDATWKNPERVISNTSDTVSWNRYDSYGRVTSALRRDRTRLPAAGEGSGMLYQWAKSETFYATNNQIDSTRSLLGPVTSGTADSTFTPSDTNSSQRVGFRYDAAGRDTARVNARGKATTYHYDRLGRLIRRRPWADSTAVRDSTVYDIAGNVHKVITRRDTTITHYYDSRNRDTLTVVPGVGDFKRTYAGPQDQLTRLWIANPVDPIGGVNGEVRYGYDTRGRLKADTAYTGTTPRVATYTYDTYERPSTTTDAIGQWSVRYETVRGLADTLITPLGDTVLVTVNSRGQVSDRVIRSTGSKMEDSFLFKMNATANQSVSTPTGPNGNYSAGAFARVTGDTGWRALSPTWTQKLGSAGATQVLQDSTAYDAWGRLTRWNGMKDGSVVQGEDYSFDRTGNISQPTGAANYHVITDRLLGRVNGAGRDSLRYDRAGNLTQLREASGVIWDYGYDALDRLVSVRRNGTLIARYAYDVLGRRIVKRVYSTASGGTLGYLRLVYRGSHVGFETDSAGTIGLTYTWGAGTDQLLAITDGATHYYATTDRLGSVRSLARRDGTWVLTQRFSPYGVRMSRDTSASFGLGLRLRYGWTGREWDQETGLSYHRARYFLPTVRRWTQEDPIGYGGGINVYAYVSAKPLEARDPNGMEEEYIGSGPRVRDLYLNSGRLEALMAWGAIQWDLFDWNSGFDAYNRNYKTLKEGVEKTNVPADIRRIFSGSKALTEREYRAIGRDLYTSLTFSNRASVSLDGRAYYGSILQSFREGRYFVNDDYINDRRRLGDSHTYAATASFEGFEPGTRQGVTALSTQILTIGGGALSNAILHEYLHQSGFAGGHCAIIGEANRVVAYGPDGRGMGPNRSDCVGVGGFRDWP